MMACWPPNAPLRSVVTATGEAPRHRAESRYLWDLLQARINVVFPLLCPICDSQMRIITFVNDSASAGHHIGGKRTSCYFAELS